MLRDSELARRDDQGQIELRPAGVRVSWELTNLATADGHTVQGVYSCTVRALPGLNDQKMLEEVFLSAGSVVTAADVANHFQRALRSAAARLARTLAAEELLGQAGRAAMIAALKSSADALAFSCGVELIPPNHLDIECPSLGREQLEQLERQTAQRRAAEHVDHLRRSAEIFDQFQKIRSAAPELAPGEVLGRLGLSDQADALRSLLLAAAHQNHPSKLWAVAGPYLIKIAGDESAEPRLITPPTELGPLRSVQADDNGHLLLGCRGGVMRMDPASPQDAALYHDPRIQSQQGFNAAIRTADRIWASHGEAGLVGWRTDQPDQPDITIPPQASGRTPRNLVAVGHRLAFSAGSQLVIVQSDGRPQPPISLGDSEITALVAQAQRILSVHEDGSICVLSGEQFTPGSPQRRAGRISAAGSIPWLGDLRLLLATEEGPIQCVGPDDELVTQYSSPHRALRIVAGSADIVAAVTADRQRLILWHSWDGRSLWKELHLYTQTRHRIADIAFI
jgi:hypothetical protein